MSTPEPEEVEIAKSPTYADMAKTQAIARNKEYQHIRDTLIETTKQNPPETIQTLLSDPDLELKDVRKLFGGLRKSFLQVLWEHRQVELWIKRATGLGVDYANAFAENDTVAKYPSRYVFFREMDEGLDLEGGERAEVVGLILQHVEVYRETLEEVRGLKEVKENILRIGQVVVSGW